MGNLLMLGDTYIQDKINVNLSDKSDIILNLEYAFCDKNTKASLEKVVLRADYDWADDFHNQVRAVSLANNHMLDFGETGLSETIAYLDKKCIGYFGAGAISNNFHNPYLYQDKDRKVAFLGYCSLAANYMCEKVGVAPFQKEQFLSDIKRCRELHANNIVVYIHWGVEESPNATEKQREIGHYLINNGCDCVVGQHPHCIQPVEIYKDKYIFYSLGNAVFPDFKVPAFYDEKGNSKMIYRKKQSAWNQMSLAVSYDTVLGNVSNISLFQFKKDILSSGTLKMIPKKMILGKYVMYWRKLSSMLKSNVLVDGKIVDTAYFRNEIRLKRKQMNGEKLK